MRCPKCHYISFGSADRCRNCGYEFALAADPTPIDLPIQSADQPIGPLGDLRLDDRPSSAAPSAGSAAEPADAGDRAPAGGRAASAPRLDLPLFIDRDPLNDAPLISVPSAPRQPLSVRRAQPGLPKPMPDRAAAPSLLEQKLRTDGDDAGPEDDEREEDEREDEDDDVRADPPAWTARKTIARVKARGPRVSSDETWTVAPVLTRLAAGIIDVLILAGVDGGVVFATLRVLGLTFADVGQLPPIPMIVFLVLLDGGYLTIFTVAGGQTIGKMIAGIRVIAQRPDDDPGFDDYTTRVTMGSAVLRASAYIVSLLPAGLGFAAILFDRDGRALHDRLAETRVVKA